MRFGEAMRLALQPMLRAAGRVPLPKAPLMALQWPFGVPPESLEYPQAYSLVGSVRFCVSLVQETLSAVPLRFYEGTDDEREEIDREPGNIVELWANANGQDTGLELSEQIVGGLLLHGNAFLFLDYAGSARVKELWCFPGNMVIPRMQDRRVIAYRVQTGLGQAVDVPPEQIVHVKMYDPEHGPLGVSPLKSLQLSYQTQRDASRYLRAFFERGGTVAGHYSMEGALGEEGEERLRKQLVHRNQGPEHAWEPVILPRNLKYVRAGLTLEEMQFLETQRVTLEDILRVYKVPPMLAGVSMGTGLNSDVARVANLLFYQNAIVPLARRIEEALNEKMLASGQFKPAESCAFDFAGVAAFQQVRLDQAKAYKDIVGGPIMTRNEARDEFGLEEIEDPALDTLLVPAQFGVGGGSVPSGSAPSSPDKGAGAEEPEPEESGNGEAVSVESFRAAVFAARVVPGRDRERARANAKLARWERLWHALQVRIFGQQERRVVAALRKKLEGRGVIARVIDVEELFKADAADRKKVQRLIEAIVKGEGDAALADLGLAVAFDMQARATADYIRKHLDRAITAVDSTTREALRESIAQGLSEGETLGDIIRRVRAVFDDRRANAITIARTETAPAFNFATVEAWTQSGVVEKKAWLTAQDDAVRDTHAAAEELEPVDLNEPFLVGDSALMYPGDPSGPPEEVINCRCTVVPVLAEQAQERMGAEHDGRGRGFDDWWERRLERERARAAVPLSRMWNAGSGPEKRTDGNLYELPETLASAGASNGEVKP